MGADTFFMRVKADSARAAFRLAQEEARRGHGHGGYTGSIAEKDTFEMVRPPREGEDLYEWEDRILSISKFDDKWGPAACAKMPDGTYIFVGWASC